MRVEETASLADDSALGILCTYLGQIPVRKQLNPNGKFTVEWDKFLDVNWEELISTAQAEGLAPLMYWLLSKSGRFSSIPELTRNTLRTSYYASWMNNQAIFKELEILTQTFEKAEIPLVVLKGACFALTVYPDIGLRPMGDLDVLVPASKLSRAVSIAKSIGYENEISVANPGHIDFYRHEVCLQKTSSPTIALELHKGLVSESYRYAIPVDWFWDQTEPMDASLSKSKSENFHMLTPTAQVLYASMHAMLQHGGNKAALRWFYDLDRLVRFYADRLDWDLLLSQSKTFEWGSALDAALSKTVACFNTPIPEQVLNSLAGISDRNKNLVLLKQIQPTTRFLAERQEFLSLKYFARFRYLLAIIIPSPDFMLNRYRLKTSWAIPAYYMIRWLDILKDGLYSLPSLLKKGFQ